MILLGDRRDFSCENLEEIESVLASEKTGKINFPN